MNDLAERITGYLASGGLFNPEMAEHEKVRDLLIDCRDVLIQVREDAFGLREIQGWQAESITELRAALAQAQASLAAARAQALEPIKKLVEKWQDEVDNAPQPFAGPHRPIGALNRFQRKQLKNCTDELRELTRFKATGSVTPSGSTALAEREALEQLIIDMRAIGKMLGEHQLASVCEDYARRAEAAPVQWKCKASAANTGANDPQDCDWPACGCDPSEPALAKLLAEERLKELNLIPQSEHWSTGLEGYIMRRKDTLMDIVAARVAELKGRKDSV